eukprot:ANDGO_06224.mRNA.1 hypothetical protein
MLKFPICIAILVSLLLLLSSPRTVTLVVGADITVSPASDIASVASLAASGDTLLFSPGTYNLTAPIVVTSKTLIFRAQGPSAKASHLLVAVNADVSIRISGSSASLTIVGLSFTGAVAFPVIQSSADASLSVQDAFFYENAVPTSLFGSAVDFSSFSFLGSLAISSTFFEGHIAQTGGTVAVRGASQVQITGNTLFSQSSSLAGSGGALYVQNASSFEWSLTPYPVFPATSDEVTVGAMNCFAAGSGGAVYLENVKNVSLSGGMFTGANATVFGGLVAIAVKSDLPSSLPFSLSILQTAFVNSTALFAGGAVFVGPVEAFRLTDVSSGLNWVVPSILQSVASLGAFSSSADAIVTIASSKFFSSLTTDATNGTAGSFAVLMPSTLRISSSSFVRGHAPRIGGMFAIAPYSTVSVSGCYFEAANYFGLVSTVYTPDNSGGVFWVGKHSSMNISNSDFFLTGAVYRGGTIFMDSNTTIRISSVTSKNSFIHAQYESAIVQGKSSGGFLYIGPGSVASLDNATISVGFAVAMGGAVFADADVSLDIRNSQFLYFQVALFGGGGVAAYSSASVSIQNSLFFKCRSNAGAGGVLLYMVTGNILVSGNTFLENAASNIQRGILRGYGGGMHVFAIGDGHLSFANNNFSGNTAMDGNGGGLSLVVLCNSSLPSRQVYISSAIFTQNSVGYYGAGLYVESQSIGSPPSSSALCTSLRVVGTSFTSNRAFHVNNYGYTTEGRGAGLFVTSLSATSIDSSVFTSNRAAYAGGAISLQYGSTNLTVTNSVFQYNSIGLVNPVQPTGGAVNLADSPNSLFVFQNVTFLNNRWASDALVKNETIPVATMSNRLTFNAISASSSTPTSSFVLSSVRVSPCYQSMIPRSLQVDLKICTHCDFPAIEYGYACDDCPSLVSVDSSSSMLPCNGNGVCFGDVTGNGTCFCDFSNGFYGYNCSNRCPVSAANGLICSGHGSCVVTISIANAVGISSVDAIRPIAAASSAVGEFLAPARSSVDRWPSHSPVSVWLSPENASIANYTAACSCASTHEGALCDQLKPPEGSIALGPVGSAGAVVGGGAAAASAISGGGSWLMLLFWMLDRIVRVFQINANFPDWYIYTMHNMQIELRSLLPYQIFPSFVSEDIVDQSPDVYTDPVLPHYDKTVAQTYISIFPAMFGESVDNFISTVIVLSGVIVVVELFYNVILRHFHLPHVIVESQLQNIVWVFLWGSFFAPFYALSLACWTAIAQNNSSDIVGASLCLVFFSFGVIISVALFLWIWKKAFLRIMAVYLPAIGHVRSRDAKKGAGHRKDSASTELIASGSGDYMSDEKGAKDLERGGGARDDDESSYATAVGDQSHTHQVSTSGSINSLTNEPPIATTPTMGASGTGTPIASRATSRRNSLTSSSQNLLLRKGSMDKEKTSGGKSYESDRWDFIAKNILLQSAMKPKKPAGSTIDSAGLSVRLLSDDSSQIDATVPAVSSPSPTPVRISTTGRKQSGGDGSGYSSSVASSAGSQGSVGAAAPPAYGSSIASSYTSNASSAKSAATDGAGNAVSPVAGEHASAHELTAQKNALDASGEPIVTDASDQALASSGSASSLEVQSLDHFRSFFLRTFFAMGFCLSSTIEPHAIFLIPVEMAKLLIDSAIIALLQSNPIAQVILLILVQVCMSSFLMYLRPFDSWHEICVAVITDSSDFLQLFLVLGIQVTGDATTRENTTQALFYLQLGTILLVLFFLVLNVILTVIELVGATHRRVRAWLRSRANRKSSAKQSITSQQQRDRRLTVPAVKVESFVTPRNSVLLTQTASSAAAVGVAAPSSASSISSGPAAGASTGSREERASNRIDPLSSDFLTASSQVHMLVTRRDLHSQQKKHILRLWWSQVCESLGVSSGTIPIESNLVSLAASEQQLQESSSSSAASSFSANEDPMFASPPTMSSASSASTSATTFGNRRLQPLQVQSSTAMELPAGFPVPETENERRLLILAKMIRLRYVQLLSTLSPAISTTDDSSHSSTTSGGGLITPTPGSSSVSSPMLLSVPIHSSSGRTKSSNARNPLAVTLPPVRPSFVTSSSSSAGSSSGDGASAADSLRSSPRNQVESSGNFMQSASTSTTPINIPANSNAAPAATDYPRHS